MINPHRKALVVQKKPNQYPVLEVLRKFFFKLSCFVYRGKKLIWRTQFRTFRGTLFWKSIDRGEKERGANLTCLLNSAMIILTLERDLVNGG